MGKATFFFNLHITDNQTGAELTSITEHTQPPKVVIPGDVNEDDKVNITDVVETINIIAKGGYDEKADLNSDQKINISDVVSIINIIAGK